MNLASTEMQYVKPEDVTKAHIFCILFPYFLPSPKMVCSPLQ